MAYTTEYDLFADRTNDLHKKVARAIDIAARDISNEDAGTANHEIRIFWAGWVRESPDRIVTEAHRIMPRVLDNVTIVAAGNAALDSDVQFVVNSLVDYIAKGNYR